MSTVLFFAAMSLFLVFPVCLLVVRVGFGLSILFAVVSFFLLQFLFVLLCRISAGKVDFEKPIEKQNRLCLFGARTMLPALDAYAGVRPVVNGMDKIPTEGRFLYVCNHRSMFDPVIVMDKLKDYNISFISKPSNLTLPLVGRSAYTIGFLPIDRENNRNALKTILTAADYLKKDLCNIGIYPEGTRSKTRELLPFHAGSFKVAQKARVPIVVACVHGTENIRPLNPFVSTKAYLDILEVIPAETACSMRTDELSEHVRSIIQQDLDLTEGKD